ncbi:tetratricopeptide repeat protein [Trinickia sp. EG282A]|uniref:tetratricopeptide repeat protein n=1 Tax=Trinickia sp. EG282A TaxID=3237013 RepID=UPI0034D2FEF5
MSIGPQPALTRADRYQAALALYANGRFLDALTILLPLLEPGEPDKATVAEALNLAAACSLSLDRKTDAEMYWRQAIRLKPDYDQAHYNLGVLLHGIGRWDEAESSYRQALTIRPDYLDARHNLCALLKTRDRLLDAEAVCREALVVLPDSAVIHHDLGTVLMDLGRLHEAEAAYRQALATQPGYADARGKLGTLLLATGRFAEGWPLYEARYDKTLTYRTSFAPEFTYPQWRGESLEGKAVLVWQEQGFGDMIQFGRYLALLKARGAAWITLACAPVLHGLFNRLAYLDAVVDAQSELARAEYDFWTLPLSIPFRLGTTVESIPSAVYLKPSAELVAKWRERLAPLTGLRVGLVWKGHPGHGNDAHRSLPSLETLAPLLSLPGVSFVSLQKGQGENELQSLGAYRRVLDLAGDIHDFADSAAVIAQLDLVVCVDTAVAHLAGGLGKPCWVLLPATGTDWRWMRERTDSPWYPGTTRLFRQSRAGDWVSVVEDVAKACAETVASMGRR